MTPTQIIETARNRYNAINDTFYSDGEMLMNMYLAQQELVQYGMIIEATFETTTVADQQDYSFPSNTISIKRVEYDGSKLKPINMREDDALTINDSATTNSGEPSYYFIWNDTISLRPIPDDAKTLKIRGFKEPDIPVIGSTLEVPSFFHGAIVDFCIKSMAEKDENWPHYDRLANKFEAFWKAKIKEFVAIRKKKDGFSVVNNEDSLPFTVLGSL